MKTLQAPAVTAMQVEMGRKHLRHLVAVLHKLEDAVKRSERDAIDSDLDMLSHKLNHIVHESTMHIDDLNEIEIDFMQPKDEIAHFMESILQRSPSPMLPKHNAFARAKPAKVTELMLNSQEFIMNFIRDIVWPEIFKRIDNKKKRKRLMLDLNRITSTEVTMVEDVGGDFVDAIIQNPTFG